MTELSELYSDLTRLETELCNAIDWRLRDEFGLPLARFEPMQVMSRVPSCRVNDIATELAITVGGTSKLVDRIEAAGHCRRRPNPDDRRSSLVILTPAGKRLLAKATEAFDEELESRIGAVLSERSLERLGTTIKKLRSAQNAESARKAA